MSVCDRSQVVEMTGSTNPCDVDHVEIRIKGKTVQVPAVRVGAATVVTQGSWVKMAVVKDEELLESESVTDPALFVSRVKAGLKADIVTFSQPLWDPTPHHKFYYEWDNLAVIGITTYTEWWKQLSDPVQRAVKKAKRLGVEVREVPFDDELVRGIQSINDETPVRQGRTFWHYQKDFDTVKDENSTYPDRNIFLGAFLQNELIGFVRIITVGRVAHIINILSKKQHYDKRPSNALLAKSVELCEQRGFTHLVYCNYVYRDPNSSLTEFKRRNRFEQLLVPRYYVPLTLKGYVVMKLRLHHGVKALIPLRVLRALLELRSRVLDLFSSPVPPATQLQGAPDKNV